MGKERGRSLANVLVPSFRALEDTTQETLRISGECEVIFGDSPRVKFLRCEATVGTPRVSVGQNCSVPTPSHAKSHGYLCVRQRIAGADNATHSSVNMGIRGLDETVNMRADSHS